MKILLSLLLLSSCGHWPGPFFSSTQNNIPEHKICLTGYMGTLSKTQVLISGAGGARSRTEEPGYATLEWDKGSLRPVLTLKRITREGKVRSETYPK
jgi:hypothetical protein